MKYGYSKERDSDRSMDTARRETAVGSPVRWIRKGEKKRSEGAYRAHRGRWVVVRHLESGAFQKIMLHRSRQEQIEVDARLRLIRQIKGRSPVLRETSLERFEFPARIKVDKTHIHSIVPGTKMNKMLRAAAVTKETKAVTTARLFNSLRT